MIMHHAPERCTASRPCVASFLLVSLAACELAAAPATDVPALSQLVDPSGPYFAEVQANGSGCPPGTTNTRISSDGLVFTTTFSSYIAQIDPTLEVGVRDCQLAIALHAPAGRSYSVASFSYAGFALLQEGVSGRQTANYYFQGNPVPPVESNRTELRGPYDGDYLFADQVPLAQRVWSPCGAKRDLNVMTRVQLFNGVPRRAGYMNLSAVDGSAKLIMVLDSRPCSVVSEENVPPPTPSAPASPLLGRYFTRTQSNWISQDGVRTVRELGLAEFVQVGDQIALHTRICAQDTYFNGYALSLLAPEALPEVRRTVSVEAEGWRTDAAPRGFGYAREGIAACQGRAGQSIPKQPGQRWITGSTCRCPVSPSSVPRADDCRVSDPDRDGQPGFAYELLGPTGEPIRTEHYAGVVRSHPVHGTIAADGRHVAEWKIDEAPYRLRCEPDDCAPPTGTEAPCASGTNAIQFAPARDAWTCEGLRERASRLFAGTLQVPTRCTRDSVSDPSR